MKKKYYFRMTVAILLLIVGVAFVFSYAVHAAPAIQIPVEEFSNLDGSAAYIRYYGNYVLDIKQSDKALEIVKNGVAETWNNVANTMFTIAKTFGIITVIIIYWCMDFDLAGLFHSQLSDMQAALNNGIFEPLFILGFCGSAIILLKKMLQRDMMGAYGQIIKVIGITMLSVLVVRDSSTVISAATNITKTAGTQALVGIQGRENVTITSYAAQTAAELWTNIIHVPWLFFEFGGDAPEGGLEYQILSLSYGSQERQDIVNSYSGDAFEPYRVAEKAGIITIYVLPLGIKCVIYILLALLTLVCQLIAIFYVLLAPLVLLLSMMPGYEGLISAWLRKLLESQLSMLIVYFLMGLITKFDNMLYEACAGAWGWMVVMVVELVVEILVFVKRDELLGVLSNMQRSVSPGYAKSAMLRGENAFQLADRGINVGTKMVGTGIKMMSGSKAAAVADVVQGSQKAKKNIVKEKVVKEADGQKAQKEETVATGSGTKQAVSDRQSANSGPSPTRIYYVYDGDYSEYGRRQVTVERPVMSGSRASNAINMEFHNMNDTSEAGNGSENAQEPRREVLRPRMDVEGNVIQFEAYRVNHEVDSDLLASESSYEQKVDQEVKLQQEEINVSDLKTQEVHPKVEKSDAALYDREAQEAEYVSSQKQRERESTTKNKKPTQKAQGSSNAEKNVQSHVAAASKQVETQKVVRKPKKNVERPRYSDVSVSSGN